MKLLTAEVGRVLSRRGVLVLLLVGFGLAVLLAAAAAYDTRPLSGTEIDAAQEAVSQDAAAYDEERARCLTDPVAVLGEGATAEGCDRLRPTLDQYLVRTPLDLTAEVDDRGTVLMALLAGVGLLVGATFGGADWANRSIGTQLLFESRRVRLWLTKALAVTLVTTVAAALVAALFWGGLSVVALARELGVDTEAWGPVLAMTGRGLALVAGATLGAFALTMVLHSTVATLGALFGYTLVVEALAASLPVARMTQWTVPHNVLAWVKDGVDINDPSICSGEPIGCTPWYTLGAGHAAAYLTVLLAVAVVVSIAVFRRRDVA